MRVSGHRLFRCAAIAAVTLVTTAGTAIACEKPAGWSAAKKIAGKTWSAWWRTNPAAIPLGDHFTVQFRLCGPAARRVTVRGWMPAHQHGMNYKPSIALKDNAGTAKGLLFHMPGKWQLILDVRGEGKREKLVAEMVLE